MEAVKNHKQDKAAGKKKKTNWMFSVNTSDESSTQDIYDYAYFIFESVSLTWELHFPKEGRW